MNATLVRYDIEVEMRALAMTKSLTERPVSAAARCIRSLTTAGNRTSIPFGMRFDSTFTALHLPSQIA